MTEKAFSSEWLESTFGLNPVSPQGYTTFHQCPFAFLFAGLLFNQRRPKSIMSNPDHNDTKTFPVWKDDGITDVQSLFQNPQLSLLRTGRVLPLLGTAA